MFENGQRRGEDVGALFVVLHTRWQGEALLLQTRLHTSHECLAARFAGLEEALLLLGTLGFARPVDQRFAFLLLMDQSVHDIEEGGILGQFLELVLHALVLFRGLAALRFAPMFAAAFAGLSLVFTAGAARGIVPFAGEILRSVMAAVTTAAMMTMATASAASTTTTVTSASATSAASASVMATSASASAATSAPASASASVSAFEAIGFVAAAAFTRDPFGRA